MVSTVVTHVLAWYMLRWGYGVGYDSASMRIVCIFIDIISVLGMQRHIRQVYILVSLIHRLPKTDTRHAHRLLDSQNTICYNVL